MIQGFSAINSMRTNATPILRIIIMFQVCSAKWALVTTYYEYITKVQLVGSITELYLNPV